VHDLGQSSFRTEPIEIPMKKSLVLVALIVSACSGEPASAPQQRIAELEQQNAQLQRDLQKARGDIEALKQIMNRNSSINAGDEDAQDNESAPGQPMVPQPSNNLGGAAAPPSG
jgi:hypothetical protein